jgi:hypothetical protein
VVGGISIDADFFRDHPELINIAGGTLSEVMYQTVRKCYQLTDRAIGRESIRSHIFSGKFYI